MEGSGGAGGLSVSPAAEGVEPPALLSEIHLGSLKKPWFWAAHLQFSLARL